MVVVRVYTDPVSGRRYVVDPATGQSRWVQPPGAVPSGHGQPEPRRGRSRKGRLVLGWGAGVLAGFLALGVLGSLLPDAPQTVQPVVAAAPTTSRPTSTTPTTSVTKTTGVTRSQTTSSAVARAGVATPTTASKTAAKATPKATAKAAPKTTRATSSECDPNYSGACVPIARDVDCAGGSGDGPAYVRGPVTVIGTDIYGLDGNDNDGIGCE